MIKYIFISMFCAVSAYAQFIPISRYPNTNAAQGSWLIVWAQPGITNFNQTHDQLMTEVGTNSIVVTELSTNTSLAQGLIPILSTNATLINTLNNTLTNGSSGTYAQLSLSNGMTTLVFDYSLAKNFEVFSTRTNATSVALTLTNITLNGVFLTSTIIFNNFVTNNLFYSFPTNLTWVWQASTNAPTPTNVFGNQMQLIQFAIRPTLNTNLPSIIGSVNP